MGLLYPDRLSESGMAILAPPICTGHAKVEVVIHGCSDVALVGCVSRPSAAGAGRRCDQTVRLRAQSMIRS